MTDNEKEQFWAAHLMTKRNHRQARRSSFDAGWDAARSVFEKAHTPTGHAKESDTSTERVKNGADSLHVTPTDDERDGFTPSVEQVWDSFSLGAVESSDLELDMVELRAMFDRFIAALCRSVVPSGQLTSLISELREHEGDRTDWTEDLFSRAADALERAPQCSEVPEPSVERVAEAVHTALSQHGHRFSLNAADVRDLGAIILSTIGDAVSAQGEPSDAQVEAAHEAFWASADITGGHDAIRAALRAAGVGGVR